MKKAISTIIFAAGLSAVAIPAYAYEYNNNDVRSDYNDIQRDRASIAADARRVEEERDELANARRHYRWAWWHGEYWAAHSAAEHAQEERSELSAAGNKLNRDVADIRRDRADLREDLAPRHHWWWY
jgi:hypothetical protein